MFLSLTSAGVVLGFLYLFLLSSSFYLGYTNVYVYELSLALTLSLLDQNF